MPMVVFGEGGRADECVCLDPIVGFQKRVLFPLGLQNFGVPGRKELVGGRRLGDSPFIVAVLDSLSLAEEVLAGEEELVVEVHELKYSDVADGGEYLNQVVSVDRGVADRLIV